MVAVGSCLVVAGVESRRVQVLDTHRNRMWNLPRLRNDALSRGMVAAVDRIAVIGGWGYPSCGTLPLMDRNSWCFRQLCQQQPSGWYHFREGMDTQHGDILPLSKSTSARKRARPNTLRGDEGKDEA